MSKIGIDLGGTKIEGILLDENNNIIERKRLPTPKDYLGIIESIDLLVQDLSSNIKQYSLGVCTPGTISKQTGLIKNSNTQCLIGKSLKTDLEKKLKKSISMENDANCFAISEATIGSAKDFDFVLGIIMGTGVGAGIIVNKKIHHGRGNIAGEWGHHIIHPDGNSCYCGKNGCAETYISGPALEKNWQQLTGQSNTLSEIINNYNNSFFNQWKSDFLQNFGLALSNVICILDPDAIVLGGGLSNINFLYDEGKKYVYNMIFSDHVDTPILKNQLGDSSGVIGAALLNLC